MGDSELTVIRSVGRGKWHIRGERGCRTAPPDPAAERSGSTAAVLEAIDEDLAARCSNCRWPDGGERRERIVEGLASLRPETVDTEPAWRRLANTE